MNRQPLKRYAPAARAQFRRAITEKAALLGLSARSIEPLEIKGDFAIVGARAFPREFAQQRAKLERWIAREGFAAVIDEVAYTWFNRLMAIRFMEINGYLEHGFLVLGRTENRPEPQILLEAENVSLPGVDADKVTQLKIAGDRDEELYRMLLLGQCHALHQAMPFLFEPISDESELLLPDALLPADSIVGKLVAEVPAELWSEIEIIGWLYQFYISDRKDEVIGKTVATPDIPAATQLFTPNWIVKYMAQNSLGRLWLEANPDSPLRAKMEFYIEPAPAARDGQSGEMQSKAAAPLEVENIRLLDPAVGSGHILVEAYDLFKAMYLERGYRLREAARLILERNLWGLDIDPRAAQMAGFALLMKARADDRRLLDNPPALHIYALRDNSELDAATLANALAPAANLLERSPLETDIAALLQCGAGAQTFGSLLRVTPDLRARLPRLQAALDAAGDDLLARDARAELQPLLDQTQTLAQTYDCVVANPPYMGSKGMNAQLKEFAAKNFPRSKADLFAMFIERGLEFAKLDGFCALITMQSWMFLSSYESLRAWILEEKTLETMAHLGARAFAEISGEVVQTTTFVIRNAQLDGHKPTFIRAVEGDETEKASILRDGENRFDKLEQKDFEEISGSPIAYWASSAIISAFQDGELIETICKPKAGISTGANEDFIYLWHEVELSKTGFSQTQSNSNYRFYPHNKAGGYCRWYGNLNYILKYGQEDIEEMISLAGFRHDNQRLYFKPSVSWGKLSSGDFSARFYPEGFTFDSAGISIFPNDRNVFLGFLNSNSFSHILSFISPTLNFTVGDIERMPVLLSVYELEVPTEEAISISRADWDSFETSWDFKYSPLLGLGSLQQRFADWEEDTQWRRARLRELETENNRLFIAAYGLGDELSPDVPDEQITLARADREDDLKRLVSYALGCLLGRYSLDESGLVYAGSGGVGFDAGRYATFPADADGIVPVTDVEWFAEDGAAQLQRWLRAAYGADDFAANLAFWAQSLGARAGETPDETLRRYLLGDFYKDHLRAYRKRPIYWQFSSGKEKAFTALVYLHRMDAGTLSRLRSSYVLPLLGRYAARINELERDVAAGTRGAEKERAKRAKQLEELRRYDELLRHRADQKWEFDLDDGVKVNYAKFAELLSESKAITGA